jgi:hypothetical protein
MKKNIFKTIFNQKGLSLVETLVGAGVLGVVTVIGMQQSDMMNQMNRNLSLDQEIVQLHSQISDYVNKKQICEANFPIGMAVTGVGVDLTDIKDGAGNPFYTKTTYLNNRIEIDQFKVKKNSDTDGVELEYRIRKLDKEARNKIILKRVNLLVETDDAVSQIEGCFNFENSLEDTVRERVSKALCDNGQGFYNAATKSCYIPGFNFNPTTGQCPAGESLRVFKLDPNIYKVECSKTFVPENCPNGWIKKANTNGSFECANFVDYIDSTTVSFDPGQTCRLQIGATNKIELKCENACTPTCPNANTICNGTLYNGPDGCSSACNVIGTKTTAECCSPSCPLPSEVCEGDTFTGADGCGGTCLVSGSKTDGVCAPPPSCPPPTCGGARPQSCDCTMMPQAICPADTTYESCHCDNQYWCVDLSQPVGNLPNINSYNGMPACLCESP